MEAARSFSFLWIGLIVLAVVVAGVLALTFLGKKKDE